MSTVVVDASVWVSYVLREDVHHQTSHLWLTGHLRGGGLVVAPTILLAEVGGPVARQTGDLTLARNTYRELLQLPTLRIVPIDYRLGTATATLAINLGLRAADAVYVALAQILAIPLITWDEQQRTRSATTITAAIPTL